MPVRYVNGRLRKTCSFILEDGRVCGHFAPKYSDFCQHHDPARRSERCQAPGGSRQNDHRPCRQKALRRGLCRNHGAFGGRKKKPVGKKLSELIEEARNDPELLDIRKALSIQTALLNELVDRVDKGGLLSEKEIRMLSQLTRDTTNSVEKFFKAEKDKAQTYSLNQVGRLMLYIATTVLPYIEADKRATCADALESVPVEAILIGETDKPNT